MAGDAFKAGDVIVDRDGKTFVVESCTKECVITRRWEDGRYRDQPARWSRAAFDARGWTKVGRSRKKSASAGGRMSRNKGKAWEREVARALRPLFGEGVKRGLAQSRFGRGEAPDVDGTAPFWFECKHGKSISFQGALEQAEAGMAAAGRGQDRWPVAACRVDRRPPLVLMRWSHFLELLAEWNGDAEGSEPVT